MKGTLFSLTNLILSSVVIPGQPKAWKSSFKPLFSLNHFQLNRSCGHINFYHINIFPSWLMFFKILLAMAKLSSSLSLLCTVAVISWNMSLPGYSSSIFSTQLPYSNFFLLMIIRSFSFPDQNPYFLKNKSQHTHKVLTWLDPASLFHRWSWSISVKCCHCALHRPLRWQLRDSVVIVNSILVASPRRYYILFYFEFHNTGISSSNKLSIN